MEFQVRFLALFFLFSVINGFGWFWMDMMSSQGYPVDAVVPQGSIIDPTLFLVYINDLPDDVVCNIAVYADDTTLYSKCDQASNLWQQLELAFELESDLWDAVDLGRKWRYDFNAVKTQLVSFAWSNNTGAIDIKMDESVLEKKSSFKSWGLPSKLDWGSYIISITKNASKKVGALICSMMEYCCHVWAGAPICYLGLFPSYINGYAGLPVFHLLPLWNPWLIIKM